MKVLSQLILLSLLSTLVLSQTNLLPNGEYNYFQWSGQPSTASPTFTLTLPESGFVVIADAFCPGDSFTLLDNDKVVGKTSVPLVSDNCATFIGSFEQAVADPRWSSGRFFLPAGTHKLTINVNQGSLSSGAAGIQARIAVCQGPPGIPSSDFALISRSVPGSSAAATCQAFGFELADITIGNIALAAQTANACLSVMKADSETSVHVHSWNTDTYGDSSIALYLARAAPSYGSVLSSDGQPHYALCQKPRFGVVTTPYVPPGIAARSPDGTLAIIQPGEPYYRFWYTCGLFGMIPAILSATRPAEFQAATTLTFSALGPNSKVWVGGWEQSAPGNNPLALHVGSSIPGGSVNPPQPSSAPGLTALPFLCRTPSSGGSPQRRSAEPVDNSKAEL